MTRRQQLIARKLRRAHLHEYLEPIERMIDLYEERRGSRICLLCQVTVEIWGRLGEQYHPELDDSCVLCPWTEFAPERDCTEYDRCRKHPELYQENAARRATELRQWHINIQKLLADSSGRAK